MIYVIPHPGFSIPDPAMAGTPDYRLPEEGREVQPSEYWTRRERDGDVIVMQVDPGDGIVKTPAPPGTEISGEA